MGDTAPIRRPDGSSLHVRELGRGGRRLALVHGWMTSGGVFDELARALDLDAWTLVIPDLVGAGGSSRPASGYTLARYAADVGAVLDARGGERPALLGHSMGGAIAALVAAERGPRLAGLALVNPVPLGGLALPAEARALFATAAGDAQKLGTILDLATRALPGAARERLVALALDVSEACLVESLDAWSRGGSTAPFAAIDAPTLVVATDDPFLPPDLLAREVTARIAGATQVHLPGAGHYPQVEIPAALARALADFLG
ncbi:MAG: alpha/beta hydrolase [Sandaracinaceae bacterium]|nr:alpha/beta hydrolase [Sandaracinaceae bacterium]